MTLQLYYYYYEEEGSSLVSKVNIGGILAGERAAESWDCFPKFLAASLTACQSWYLCLIVIAPPRADHYLAACLHCPSHFLKEIIMAAVLCRGLQVCSWLLPPCESPSAGGFWPQALKGNFPFTRQGKWAHCYGHCLSPSIWFHPPSQRFWVSFSPTHFLASKSYPSYTLPLSLEFLPHSFISLTAASLLSAGHWVTSPAGNWLGWRTVMFFWVISWHRVCPVTWRSSLNCGSWCVNTKHQQVWEESSALCAQMHYREPGRLGCLVIQQIGRAFHSNHPFLTNRFGSPWRERPPS